jgi:hypothetical protein
MELILDATKYEATTIQAEGNVLVWEDLLGGQTSNMISATCCKAVEHATLACQEIQNGKAPILIPWKCTYTTTCNDSRAGKDKKGKQNTQIELTDALLPLKDVLAPFKIHLDKSRTHYNESEWLCNVQKVDIATI